MSGALAAADALEAGGDAATVACGGVDPTDGRAAVAVGDSRSDCDAAVQPASRSSAATPGQR